MITLTANRKWSWAGLLTFALIYSCTQRLSAQTESAQKETSPVKPDVVKSASKSPLACYPEMVKGFKEKKPEMISTFWAKNFTCNKHWKVVQNNPDKNKTIMSLAQATANLQSAFPGNRAAPSENYFIRSAKSSKNKMTVVLVCYSINQISEEGNDIISKESNEAGHSQMTDVWVRTGKTWKLQSRRQGKIGYDAKMEKEFNKASKAGKVIE